MATAQIRRGNLGDIEFIRDAIIEAERSGTSYSMYERAFELTEPELRSLIEAALREEIDGCELCCDSFWLAIRDGVPQGCIATWIEADDGPSSSHRKAQLLAHTLGLEKWKRAQDKLRALAVIDIPRRSGALQIESVYTAPSARGAGIAAQLIEHAISDCRATRPDVSSSQILSIVGNESSARAFRRAGFQQAATTSTADSHVRELFPGSGRVQWERTL